MNYFVAVNGQSTGPFTLDQLKKQGVTPQTLIWHEGLPGWVAAETVAEVNNYLFNAGGTETVPLHVDNNHNTPDVLSQKIHGVSQQSIGHDAHVADGCPPVRLGLAIFSAIMFPLGIAAIVKSALVRPRWNAGRYEDAEYLSASSKKFAIMSIIFGAIFWVIYIVYIVAMVGIAASSSYYY